MSDKTLVERLRNGKKKSICLPGNLENILGVKFPCYGMECDECYDRAFNALADAIERDYQPRQKTEILDAEGVPIHVGDKVWYLKTNKYLIVSELGKNWFRATDNMKHDPLSFSHKQPDSLERIEEDAKKQYDIYWKCSGIDCCDCPAIINGKKPDERYETVGDCLNAQKLDLLHRQRKILERNSNG